jgi:hypothetical protein
MVLKKLWLCALVKEEMNTKVHTEIVHGRVGVAVTLLTPLRVVPFSILGQDTGHPDFLFRGYPQSPQANSDKSISTSSRSFPIHHP